MSDPRTCAVHRFFLDVEHPTPDDVGRVWKGVLSCGDDEADAPEPAVSSRPIVELPYDEPLRDLVLSCSVSELQDAANRIPAQALSLGKPTYPRWQRSNPTTALPPTAARCHPRPPAAARCRPPCPRLVEAFTDHVFSP